MKKLIKVLAVGMLLATTLIGCEKQEMYNHKIKKAV
jgi:hypothetical protein